MPSTCDGTKRNGTRNCDALARWLVRRAEDKEAYYASCDRHLSQVARNLLEGEHGKLEIHNMWANE